MSKQCKMSPGASNVKHYIFKNVRNENYYIFNWLLFFALLWQQNTMVRDDMNDMNDERRRVCLQLLWKFDSDIFIFWKFFYVLSNYMFYHKL